MLRCLLLMLAMMVCAVTAAASQEQSADTNAVARELSNPNNSLASLTFKNQYRWYTGDLPGTDSQDNYTLLFQPAFPFSLQPTDRGAKANVFLRPAIPLFFNQPVLDTDTDRFDNATALVDIGFDAAYGVTEKSGLLWAIGMVGTLPTATGAGIAGKQWRLGPELLIAKMDVGFKHYPGGPQFHRKMDQGDVINLQHVSLRRKGNPS